MSSRSRTLALRCAPPRLVAAGSSDVALRVRGARRRAQLGPIPNPCDLPGPGFVCDAVGDVAGDVAGAAGDFVMRGVTVWVTNAAVWVTGKVGELIDATASPDVGAAGSAASTARCSPSRPCSPCRCSSSP